MELFFSQILVDVRLYRGWRFCPFFSWRVVWGTLTDVLLHIDESRPIVEVSMKYIKQKKVLFIDNNHKVLH